MKNYLNIKVLLVLLLVTTLISCVEERFSLDCKKSNYTEQHKVSFMGNYAATKSASAIAAGVVCSIFTYYTGENPLTKMSHPETPITAVSNLSGELISSNNSKLYLAPNSYDFYAISANYSSLIGLTFKMGQSNRLKNGVDYLWSQKKEIAIYNQTQVTFNFKHLSSLIIVQVNPLIKSQKIELTLVKIGVPDSLQTITLASGKINPCSKITTPKEKMKIDENRASYIVLPIQKGSEIPIELNLTLSSSENIKTENKYLFSLPSPPNGFEGGTQYKYRVKVGSNKIVFENTSVEPWKREEVNNIHLSETK